MTEFTSRHALPLLQPGQAQKEMWHNEALALADALLHPVAEAEQPAPPADPAAGQCWIVGAAPTGDWTGQAGALAAWTGGGWRFAAAREGMAVWLNSAGCTARFDGAAWTVGQVDARVLRIEGMPVVGAQAPAIAGPAGGATVDTQAREAVNAILAALRAHGLIAHQPGL